MSRTQDHTLYPFFWFIHGFFMVYTFILYPRTLSYCSRNLRRSFAVHITLDYYFVHGRYVFGPTSVNDPLPVDHVLVIPPPFVSQRLSSFFVFDFLQVTGSSSSQSSSASGVTRSKQLVSVSNLK